MGEGRWGRDGGGKGSGSASAPLEVPSAVVAHGDMEKYIVRCSMGSVE